MSAATDRVEKLRKELALAEQEVQAEKDAVESQMTWQEFDDHMREFLQDNYDVTAKGPHGTFIGIAVDEDDSMRIDITEWDTVKHSIQLDTEESVNLVEKILNLGILHISRPYINLSRP
jgi:hypothetical protein